MKDIAFGSLAGMVSEVFEYPFDLAKVRLQAQLLSPAGNLHKRFNGPLDCLMQTWKEEGFRGLYRGLPAPIVGSMAETAALFLSYSAFQNLIRTHSSMTSLERSTPLSIPQLGLAAAGAGFVTSFILTPIELVKCKMQVQMMNVHASPMHVTPKAIPPIFTPVGITYSAAALPRYSPILNFVSNTGFAMQDALHTPRMSSRLPGPFSILRTTVERHGVTGLWLGHTGTILRETGGSAAWFVVKEWVAGLLKERRLRHTLTDELIPRARVDVSTTLLPWESAVSGAIAGAVGALVLYPADTVKSAMQTEEELRSHTLTKVKLSSAKSSKPLVNGFWKTAVHMYKIHGVRGLYAGCGMTVVRAVPSSGIIFVVYDGLTAWFG
ncbi:mitochondrial carrier domain-containing protein [Crucibulum laeve]|uniref:Mitochondrial carrier domain-containing protein n=1 Tax=Crucibulum laeve TaxID=68775 RepID=A0A5C3M9Q3_9AGAR|nr:mitochondrial carrier domain-containing protein [Crucibulum laeve]